MNTGHCVGLCLGRGRSLESGQGSTDQGLSHLLGRSSPGFPLDPTDPPQSVFIPGQLTLEQEDLNAEEFSDFIPFEDLSDTGRG